MLNKKVSSQVLLLMCISIILLLSSCASKKDILYFQGVEDQEITQIKYETTIEKNDILSIVVSAENEAVAAPFNLGSSMVNNNVSLSAQSQQSYLVDSKGYVDMPKLGSIKLAGLTKPEAKSLILDKLKIYIKNPIVNIRILNYRITILGDVTNPGPYTVPNENINIVEAIGLAGDLQITGKRKNILVIRESDTGKQTTGIIDFTNGEMFSSPFYNLKQNDIVYVTPNNAKIQRSAVNPNTGLFFSITSLLITIFVLFIR